MVSDFAYDTVGLGSNPDHSCTITEPPSNIANMAMVLALRTGVRGSNPDQYQSWPIGKAINAACLNTPLLFGPTRKEKKAGHSGIIF